jgi:mannose-6-phosphate isomerase-like protein (cupin superfamily)
MPQFIEAPAIVTAAGNKPKKIEEYAGRASTGHTSASVARMISPGGWVEPAQTPQFEEITVVLRGMLRVESGDEIFEVRPGQGIVTHPGETVRYSTPDADGAEYIAVCIPAFSPDTVHRVVE